MQFIKIKVKSLISPLTVQSDLCLIVNIFSAVRIQLSSRLSPSDWAELRGILKTAGTWKLEIKTEVSWKELETALIELPEISVLILSDNQWDKIRDLLTNIDNKQLELSLSSEVKSNTTVRQWILSRDLLHSVNK